MQKIKRKQIDFGGSQNQYVRGDGELGTFPNIPDITTKTDKVINATDGNFAALDNTGNLKDSGKNSNSFHPIITNDNKLSADFISNGSSNKVFTSEEKEKLQNIEDYAQKNVQIDWNENDSSSDAYIRNKPTIPSALDDLSNVNIDHPEDYDALLYSEVHSKWDNTHLHPVAITGNYNSLNNKPTIPAAQVQSDWNQSDNQQADYIKNKPLIHDIPSGGTLGQVLKKNSSADYAVYWGTVTDTIPSVYCNTRGNIAAKKGTCSVYSLQNNQYLQVLIGADNTTQEALTLNINSAGAKPIYINGTASSSSNYTLPNGYYFVFYDGTNYQFRTDGKLPMLNGAFGGSYNDLADKPTITRNVYYATSLSEYNDRVVVPINSELVGGQDFYDVFIISFAEGNQYYNNKDVNLKFINDDFEFALAKSSYFFNSPCKYEDVSNKTFIIFVLKDSHVAGIYQEIPAIDIPLCKTDASSRFKTATCSYFSLNPNSYLNINIQYSNTYAGAITLNINGSGNKQIYINGSASSSTNYTLPAGFYIVFYDGTNYYFRTDGKLHMKDAAFGGSYNDLADKPSPIPTPTSSDEGKLLSVDSNGNYVLITILNSENIPY